MEADGRDGRQVAQMKPIEGAEILARRLGKAGLDRPASYLASAIPDDALPLFRWLGVQPCEPPEGQTSPGIDDTQRPSRRRRR